MLNNPLSDVRTGIIQVFILNFTEQELLNQIYVQQSKNKTIFMKNAISLYISNPNLIFLREQYCSNK